jgi:sulfate permease, SulP family
MTIIKQTPWWQSPWLHGYQSSKAMQDLVAGLVVTVLLVPQSLAYAMLAGLPPHFGMYASILPLLAYAWLGSSMTLAVGPVAVAALMTASAVTPLAAPGSALYAELAVLLAMLGGVVLLVLGFMRMGFIANLLSHPVISGFVTGSAVLIALGQLKSLLGIPMTGHSALELAASVISQAGRFHAVTAVIGLASVLLLWGARRYLSRMLGAWGLPAPRAELLAKLAPMVVVLLNVLAVFLWDLDTRYGVAVVGAIPSGLPHLQWIWPSVDQIRLLAAPAAVIALVGFVESVSVAQSLAIKRGERINPDRELRGLGLANLASAVSGGFPVTGGFARSVVNFAAGARTPLAGVVAAVLMALVLLGLTGLFERLPLAVLAATIVVAVLGLVDTSTLRHAWRYDRADALAFIGTMAGVLVLGVEAGIGIGVSLSVGVFLWRATRPHIAVLGRVAGTEHFRNELRFTVQTWPGMVLLRIDENLFFANIAAVIDRIEAELQLRPGTKHLVLAMTSVSHIDLSAVEALERLTHELDKQGIDLHLAEVKGPVLDRLQRGHWLAMLAQPPFVSLHAAVQALDFATE